MSHREHPRSPERRPASRPLRDPWLAAALGYIALIVYGSLFPFVGWQQGQHGLLAFVMAHERERVHLADALTNVLAYGPLGALLALALARRMSSVGSVGLAVIVGSALSFAMELLQQFLPSRVASLQDCIANTAGTLVGALIARSWVVRPFPFAALARWRDRWIAPGPMGEAGLIVIALWALSQLAPLVPSLDIGKLRAGLAPVWHTLHHPEDFRLAQWTAYTLGIAGLALLARTFARGREPSIVAFAAFVSIVLVGKAAVVGRQLSLEALTGALCGIAIAVAVRARQPRTIASIAAMLILVGFAADEVRGTSSTLLFRFSWIPFSAQLDRPLAGIVSILECLWPAAALAYCTRLATDPGRASDAARWGGLLLAATAFGLEWHQQSIPGRVGDITTVLLMVGAWTAMWTIRFERSARRPSDDEQFDRTTRRQRRTWFAACLLGGAIAVVASTAVLSGRRADRRAEENRPRLIPHPGELPPARLVRFNLAHPRLPHPSTSDLDTLRARNPEFETALRDRARGGKGDLDAAILQAFAEPGAIDTNEIFARLVRLRFAGRGDAQAKPLGVAYDWLHAHWSDEQRARLRDKLVEGCHYLIEVIRNAQLSPYNVILYNAPLQALMACAIAVYEDDPRAEPIMRFLYDTWNNRVLPVWKQVMGRNGGWHEGGEYVSIGIGQAIYTLPAMWRAATGEDLFASEPGIRGFLEFLIYRTRPDETDFRWGDGAYFDRPAPDAIPLALELRNAAAYSLHRPAGQIVPTGWPWGPINDPALFDANACSRLPLTRVFDGLGMIVARSDWTPDATYVTFKAGDNFWSHAHLDQGAFTIYKGGALAIDSGLYGPTYDSDHHMNYSYQTIAHNTITVTDPEDNVPAPGKKDPRHIANDGGQRRVGSGWGVDAAPLDRAEWEAKRETYHTGTLESVFDDDSLIVAVADVTPAYTNTRSGEGTFADRTRRVERFWRTFGYDRVDDAVVVFDQVSATQAAFRKRWLLHTIEAPEFVRGGFRVHIGPQARPGHAGGTLTAHVLLPADALMSTVGGRGLEFFVDELNYDENGTLQAMIAKLAPNKGEPGAWRIQVAPPRDETDDLFLVVLLPTLGDSVPSHRVRLLRAEGRVGCEIIGPQRTTRWWFRPGQNGAEVEVDTGSRYRHHRIEDSSAFTARRWLDGVLKGRDR